MKAFDIEEFGISRAFLDKILYCKPDNYEKYLSNIKGIEGLASLLKTDLKQGISDLNKKNTFIRKKILDPANFSRKLTINDYHFYSSLFHIFLYFLLSILKVFKINQTDEYDLQDFIESIGFFIIGVILLVASFMKINKFLLIVNDGINPDYKVLRNGKECMITPQDLLIGDLLIINENQNLGLVSGILIEGELETLAKDSTIPKIIKTNEKIFHETIILSGKAIVLVCKLGLKDIDNDNLTPFLDKTSMILYNIEENSGVFGRLLAWTALMIIITHCYFLGKMDLLNIFDVIILAVGITVLMYPIRVLLWIMNFLNRKYQKKIYEEFGIKLRNLNSLNDVSYFITESNKFLDEKSLKVQYISNYENVYEINELKQSNQLKNFKGKIISCLDLLIEKDISSMSKTEESLDIFLNILSSSNEKNYFNMNSLSQKIVIETEKNYKGIQDSKGFLYKIGEYEDIIEECELEFHDGATSALNRTNQDNLLIRMQLKDVDKILALSFTNDNKKTIFLGLFGFKVITERKQNISNCLELLKKLSVKLILLSKKDEEFCEEIKEKLKISEIKRNDDVINEDDQYFSNSCIISQIDSRIKKKLVKIIKNNGNSLMLSIKNSDSFLFPINDPSVILFSFKEIERNMENILIPQDSLHGLIKSLYYSLCLTFHLKNCLFSKTIISVTLIFRLMITFCLSLHFFTTVFNMIVIFLFLDLYMVIWIVCSNDISECNISKNKEKGYSSLLISKKDIVKIVVFAIINSLFMFLMEFYIPSEISSLFMGITTVLLCCNTETNISKKQIFFLSLCCIVIGHLLS